MIDFNNQSLVEERPETPAPGYDFDTLWWREGKIEPTPSNIYSLAPWKRHHRTPDLTFDSLPEHQDFA